MLTRIVWSVLEWPIALASLSFAWLVKRTSRVELRTAEPQGPAIYVNWHRHQSFLISYHGDRRRWMLVSPAPQLTAVARFCRLMGLRLVRGASGDRGRQAFDELETVLSRGESVALAVDGPRGPAFHAKKGCVDLARSAGVPIVPIAYRATRAHEFRWRWDRMLMPLPFARIEVLCGAPISATGDDDQMLANVERQLNSLEGS
jgi:lysophospholipid acyltransferase (LPLAT)-like uncharacterized protein